MEGINGALMLMIIGMGTVFLMLILVIVFSQILIRVTNLFPSDEPAPARAAGKQAEVPSKVIAAITAAVNIASGGKAKVVKVEKVK